MDERRDDQPETTDGALDPDERFGQGVDRSHPESATGQPIERAPAAAEPNEELPPIDEPA